MKTRMTAPAFVLLLVVVPSLPLRADEPRPLAPGARVRVTEGDALGHQTLRGTVKRIESEALTLDADSEWADQAGTVRTIPRERIVRLEIQVRPPDRTRGALKGLGVGLLAGVALVLVHTQLNNGSPLCNSTTPCDAEILLGAALGGGLGAAVGATSAQPEWRELPLPPRVADAAAAGPPSPAVSRRWR